MQIVPKDYALELSIFAVQKLALHPNGVEFRRQSIGDTKISLAMSYRIKVFCLHTHSLKKLCMKADTLPKNYNKLLSNKKITFI